jgi:hypothetical protein
MFNNKEVGNNSEDMKGKKPMFEIKEIKPESKNQQVKTSWNTPDNGCQCLNVDASFVKESNSTSWGAVIRDHLGQIGLSAWGFIRECDSAEIAEAIACLEDVKQTLNWVESDLIIESDCAAVIKKASSN